MSDKEIEKEVKEINGKLDEIMEFISKRDRITSSEYCELRGIKLRTLIGWFKKGCPREDARHVSIKAVDNWARTKNTRKSE